MLVFNFSSFESDDKVIALIFLHIAQADGDLSAILIRIIHFVRFVMIDKTILVEAESLIGVFVD